MSHDLPARYSSTVQLQLIVGNQTLGLSRIGPRSIQLQHAQDLPAGDAEVVMSIDGQPRVWPVTLIHGAVPYETEVAISERM